MASPYERPGDERTRKQRMTRRDFLRAAAGLTAATALSSWHGQADAAGDLVLPVPAYRQRRGLSCEAAAAGMAATFLRPTPPQGFSVWEEAIIARTPLDRNPFHGFRGNINGYQSLRWTGETGRTGYGVYHTPVAEAVKSYGLGAEPQLGANFDLLQQHLSAHHVVVVWVFLTRYYNPATMKTTETTPATGEKYDLYLHEHAVTVVGMSADRQRVLINDPYSGQQRWVASNDGPDGLHGWQSMFNGMRVVIYAR